LEPHRSLEKITLLSKQQSAIERIRKIQNIGVKGVRVARKGSAAVEQPATSSLPEFIKIDPLAPG
jgi:hypothetical protein